MLAGLSLAGLTLMSLFWWVWWNRAVTAGAEKEQLYRAWRKSDDDLQQSMLTIDQLTAAVEPIKEGDAVPPALVKAMLFYERIIDKEGPPARNAHAHYRLGKIHERVGDHEAAQLSYQEALTNWEASANDSRGRADLESIMEDCRQRFEALRSQKKR